MTLVRITAKHFCADIVLQRMRSNCTPTIVDYMKYWTLEQIQKYCRQKCWLCEIVNGP